MARVGVVVVTYRSAATVRACVASLRGASSEAIEIVVVDNASDDNSISAATSADAEVILVSRPSNDGYGAGCNAGVVALAPGTEFVVFANADTVWPAGTIDALLERYEPSVGLLSPFLVNQDGSAQAIVEDDLTLRATVLGMTRLAAPVRPRVPSRSGGLVDVDWLHTAAAVVPVPVLTAVGGFDERFFLFAEDADLCRRVRVAGKRVVIAPDVAVTHVGGASFDVSYDADGSAALRTRALATYLEKYQGKLARRVFGAVGTVVYGLARHRGQAREAWRALVR